MIEPSRDPSALAVELSIALMRVRSRLRTEAGTASTGFTLSELSILDFLHTNGPAAAATLAKAQHVSPQAIAQNLARLKDSDFVLAERDPSDKRRVLIGLSPHGRDQFAALMATRETWLAAAITATLDGRERSVLAEAVALLERLAAADLGPQVGLR